MGAEFKNCATILRALMLIVSKDVCLEYVALHDHEFLKMDCKKESQ